LPLQDIQRAGPRHYLFPEIGYAIHQVQVSGLVPGRFFYGLHLRVDCLMLLA